MCLKDDQSIFYFCYFGAEFQNVSKELTIDCFQSSPFIDILFKVFALTTHRFMLHSFLYTIKDIQSSLNLLVNVVLVSHWKMHSSMSHF